MVDLAAATAPRLLPEPGATRLDRSVAAEAQRRRLLRAVAEVVATKGYAGTAVGDVVREAGVSRRTFYEQFSSKEACFLACIDAGAAGLAAHLDALEAADRRDGATPAAVVLDRWIAGYLDLLAAEPAFARSFLIETYAAGPEALARRYEHARRFARYLGAFYTRAAGEGLVAECAPDVDLVAGAISWLVTMEVALGRAGRLPQLKERLIAFVLGAGGGAVR